MGIQSGTQVHATAECKAVKTLKHIQEAEEEALNQQRVDKQKAIRMVERQRVEKEKVEWQRNRVTKKWQEEYRKTMSRGY